MVERIELTEHYTISRVIKGGWHLAGGHGPIDRQEAIEDMRLFVEKGITTFDCADIYTGVEELIGDFLRMHADAFSSGNLPPIQIQTKYVPDYNALSSLKKEDTEFIIDRSLARLGVDQLDMVQFAWWNFSVPGHVEAAHHLQQLQEAGKIRHLAVTNYDAKHLQELLDADVSLVSNQVQYSILDRRPEHSLLPLCKKYGIHLLCYGSVAGGFFSEHYLEMGDDPIDFENRSLTKYGLIIEEFGGFQKFKNALETLQRISKHHKSTIAEVAIRYILQKPQVAGAIVGARNHHHLESLTRLDRFQLSQEELTQLDQLADNSPFSETPVYEMEREKSGRHGVIMRYNLNNQRP